MLGLFAGAESFQDIPVSLPEIESESPVIIRVCPESGKGVVVNGYVYFDREKGINCTTSVGAA